MFHKEVAVNYDEWYKNLPGSFVDEVENKTAFSLFELPTNTNILDIGCGTGNFTLRLARKGYQVTGIDISNHMLTIAKEKAKQENLHIDFIQMDLYDLDFPDNHFSGVFSMAAFEFVKKPIQAYQELYRVVKPGGQILIGTINKDSPWGEFYREMARQDQEEVFNHAHFINLQELKNLDPLNLINSQECLFIPPTAPNTEFNWQMEKHYSTENSGGFIICLWQKPK